MQSQSKPSLLRLKVRSMPTRTSPTPTDADILQYIADMLSELKGMAARCDATALEVLLGVAQREAEERAARRA